MPAAASAIVRVFRFTRALRFRIAVSYVIFFALLLLFLGGVFRRVLNNIVYTQTQDLLKEDWDAMKGYLRIDRTGMNWFYDHTDPEEDFIVHRLARAYMIADSEGHPLQWSEIYKSIGFDSPAYIKSIVRSGEKDYQTRIDPQSKTPYMIVSGVVSDEHHDRYYVAIGRPITTNEITVQEFTWRYYIILPLAVAFSALFGWFLAGRGLAPVNHVAETAERITHSNLNMRLQPRGAHDELDRLVDSFNRMMERLNFSFEQIRQFSTDVSHELRTPLTVIRGQLEVALFTANTVEQYRDAMVNALEEVERLSNIVRALLMLSQAESGQLALNKTDVDLCENVADLCEQYQIAAEAANVRLEWHVGRQHCHISADRVQIERLVTNLLSNAIKYTPAEGRVNVRVEADHESVHLIVEDNGVGIAPDHLPHIFDRFYRVPSADPEKGLGLGLSFVAWIVKAHGGGIDVQSELNKGTRFTVTFPALPRVDAPETAALAAPSQANPVN